MRLVPLVVILATLLAPVAVMAQPSVSGSSGEFDNDGSVWILGSDFGSKSTAAPIRWDNFDNGVDSTYIQTGGYWTSLQGGACPDSIKPRYMDEYLRNGSGLNAYVGLQHNDNYSQYNMFYRSNIDFATNNKALVCFWVRYDFGVPNNGHQIKLWRVSHDAPYTDQETYPNIFFNDSGPVPGGWDRYQFSPRAGCGEGAESIGGSRPTLLTWVRVMLEWDFGEVNVGDTGELTIWHDNVVQCTEDGLLSGQTFICHADQTPHSVSFGQYAGNTPDTDIANEYFDDIYIDNTWARVEIGNASTYSESDHKEMQIPSYWASDGDSIQITVNTGSFVEDDEAYLFVVDSDGDVSSGYQLIIGSSGVGAPEDPPASVAPCDSVRAWSAGG